MTEIAIWEAPKLPEIRKTFAPNLTDLEFSMFVQLGVATGLNPFLRELWAVKYGNSSAQVFIGRDGYRKGAQRHPLYDYHLVDAVYENDRFGVQDGKVTHEYNLTNRGKLLGAYCTVKRKYTEGASYVFVELSEYTTGKSLWGTKPATMIKKVAEAQALRMAFQDLFKGTYAEEEAWRDNQQKTIDTTASKSRSLEDKLGICDVTIFGEPSQLDSVLALIQQAKTMEDLEKTRTYGSKLQGADKQEAIIAFNIKKQELMQEEIKEVA